MNKKQLLTCLINFLIAALLGLTLRFAFLQPININYRFFTHAHSHVAILGWVYLMLFCFIIYHFIPERKPVYNKLFWLTQFSVTGMMLSFPFQGYAAVSISFSTLHILCSYYFAYLVLKNVPRSHLLSHRLLRTSVIFMLISTIGVWCLGPAVSMGGQTSAIYQAAIQFFLHFQFNGWFLPAVLAVFIKQLEPGLPELNKRTAHRFLILLIIITILTFSLPLSWYAPHPFLKWINAVAVILQLLALSVFMHLIKDKIYKLRQSMPKLQKLMLYFALGSFILKILLQSTSVIPQIYESTMIIRNFVIGFIHLLMLGVISGFLFLFLAQSDASYGQNNWLKYGYLTFITGFAATEIILFVQGLLILLGKDHFSNYYLMLFLVSILLPISIILIIKGILFKQEAINT